MNVATITSISGEIAAADAARLAAQERELNAVGNERLMFAEAIGTGVRAGSSYAAAEKAAKEDPRYIAACLENNAAQLNSMKCRYAQEAAQRKYDIAFAQWNGEGAK